jgi:uncharacterized membrane protein
MAEEKTTSTPDKDVEENKGIAALSYVWILFLVPLLGKKDSKFAQFHAKQGLILFIISFATIIPVFGWILFLVIILTAIVGIIKTLSGEWWKIPFVYDLSKKINL